MMDDEFEFDEDPYNNDYEFVPAVRCRDHGYQALEMDDYNYQMSKPDSLWKCPLCGQSAIWEGNE